MAKKKAKRKHYPWNKGREVGRQAPLTPSEVTRIKKALAKRGDAGLRDLALFSTAIDTMLRASDLLGLTVKDVRKRNRLMRDTFDLTTARYGQPVNSAVSSKPGQKILGLMRVRMELRPCEEPAPSIY